MNDNAPEEAVREFHLPSTSWLEQAASDGQFLVIRDGGDKRFRVNVEEATADTDDGEEVPADA